MVHAGTARSGFDETCEAIFMTSGFVYGTAEEAEAAFANDGSRFVYSRFRNPTVSMFEDRLAAYEGAERCFATASGMAAVFAALMSQLKAGDRIVAPHALFGSCLHIVKNLAPQFGIETTLVNGTDADEWRAALSRPANIVFLETPSNPMLDVVDLALVSELAHAAGARVVVDNVFATPALQRPLGVRRRCRGLFGHQAHRRPGPQPGRRHPVRQQIRRDAGALPAPHRPCPQPLQRMAAAEGP